MFRKQNQQAKNRIFFSSASCLHVRPHIVHENKIFIVLVFFIESCSQWTELCVASFNITENIFLTFLNLLVKSFSPFLQLDQHIRPCVSFECM